MTKTIIDVLKPTEKTYIINGRKYVAIIDFIKNRFSLKYGKRINWSEEKIIRQEKQKKEK